MENVLPRWEQKLNNYRKALRRLAEVVNVMDSRQLNDFAKWICLFNLSDMEFGLKDMEIKALRDVLASVPEVEEAIIYGSRARGTNRKSSDIDMTLKGDNLTYLQLALLDAKIDDLYLPYFVDLSLYSMIKNVDLIASIEREGKVLYNNGMIC